MTAATSHGRIYVTNRASRSRWRGATGRALLVVVTLIFFSPVLLSIELSFRTNTQINVAPLTTRINKAMRTPIAMPKLNLLNKKACLYSCVASVSVA